MSKIWQRFHPHCIVESMPILKLKEEAINRKGAICKEIEEKKQKDPSKPTNCILSLHIAKEGGETWSSMTEESVSAVPHLVVDAFLCL
ncbi:hypothetical protein L6452_42420 [Arctium lappa]|uniref:Uncharacterized protein n=1 Tax=Arctium lappa TaxID=4217 RepID=A0ACB8XIW4_ARCLA|nr:hypothetical protein L6452_42420 [Arctium lappa]